MDQVKKAAAYATFVALLGAGAAHTKELNEICVADKAALAYGVAAVTGDGLPSWTPPEYATSALPNMLGGPEANSDIYNKIIGGTATAAIVQPRPSNCL